MSPELQLGIIHELDQRRNDKLVITLWWVEGTMDTFVTVRDEKFGNNFSLDVPSPDLAGHYFRHAMSYTPEDNQPRRLYAATEADLGEAA